MAIGDWHKRMMGGAKGLIAQPPIGVDFGVGALKVLQIATGDSPGLVGAACLPTPDDLLHDPVRRLAFQVDAFPTLMKQAAFKTRRAACAIPAGHSFCKHMQFQMEAGVASGSLVKSAISTQLGCDPSMLVFRHVEVGPVGKSNKTEVIGMAAARETIDRLMGALKAAKLEPVGMHSEHHALLRAFDSITRRTEDNAVTTLYLDIGAGTTKVAIAHGRELVFARTIELGGRNLDQAVARQLKLGAAEGRAHRLAMLELGVPARAAQPAQAAAPQESGMAVLSAGLRQAGESGALLAPDHAGAALMEDRRVGAAPPGLQELAGRSAGPMRVDLSEPLEILTDEISMCLRYHESLFDGRKVDRTVFVGGEARHVALCQHIARTLKLPAKVGDPMASISRSGREPCAGVDFTVAQPGWAVALGLCLSPTDL
jgi:type IV pilus assembly protein PilM